MLEPAVDKDGHEQCKGNTSRETGTVRGTARRPHFSLAFISVNRSTSDVGVFGYIGVF